MNQGTTAAELPVYENETRAGTLRVCAQGLYTLFEARLPAGKPGELTRLWLGGGTGDFASLGLLEPGREERRLRRKLSRLELEKLPPAPWIALALPAGESPPEEGLPCAGGMGQTPSYERRLTDEGPSVPHSEFRKTNSEFAWTSCPDGSLVDPARRLLALPCALRQEGAGLRKIHIGGQDYLVFHY